MNRKFVTVTAVVVIAVAAAGLWAWRHSGPSGKSGSASELRAEAAKNMKAGVFLSQEERERAGIATAAVQAIEQKMQSAALATVLPIQELVDAAAAMASARAQADRAEAAAAASRRDFERLQGLHAQDRNVSDRALEVAEATWRADDAGGRAARAALDAARATARSRWGDVLAQALATRGPLWRQLESGQYLLLRVVATSGAAPAAMPATIEVEAPDGAFRTARVISAAPASDPRIQGTAFFYETAAAGLAPGMTLAARFGAGRKEAGAVLPPDALLWWQGKQWAYVEVEPGRFERREAVAAQRVERGWFIPGFPPATVVSRGAQALLSQELRPVLQAGEEGEK